MPLQESEWSAADFAPVADQWTAADLAPTKRASTRRPIAPLSPEELADRIMRPGQAMTILKTLSGARVYKGLRPVY